MADELKRLQRELDETKTALEKAQTELREYKLWAPLRDLAAKAGLAADSWQIARLDLAEHRRVGLDVLGEPVILENGRESTVTPERFFKEIYRKERPSLYDDAPVETMQTAAAGTGGRRVIKRAAFDQMSPREKGEYCRTGGRVVD